MKTSHDRRAAGAPPAARLRFASTLALCSVLIAAAWAAGAPEREVYLDGPPPQHTGGFGEPTCHFCHFDSPVNEEGGTLVVKDLPDAFEPGKVYTFTVELRHAELSRGGFQLAFRNASGDNKQAGSLKATDPEGVVITEGTNGVSYAHHVRDGTEPASRGVARWTLEWTAPASAIPVVLSIAANAANADDSEAGDRIYTLQKTLGNRE